MLVSSPNRLYQSFFARANVLRLDCSKEGRSFLGFVWGHWVLLFEEVGQAFGRWPSSQAILTGLVNSLPHFVKGLLFFTK